MLVAVCLACGIHVKDDVTASLPIQIPDESFAIPCKALLLEELAKRFQAGTVYTSEETTQALSDVRRATRPNRDEVVPKRAKRSKEVGQCPFSADQKHRPINKARKSSGS